MFGETRTLVEWSEDPRCVVTYNTLGYRIRKGYDAEWSITAPRTSGGKRLNGKYAMSNLFQSGDFTLHSGQRSNFKIDCDALTDADWETLAVMAVERLEYFTAVEGVPRGGLKLAAALEKHKTTCADFEPQLLIVDDVLTTGASMEKQRADRDTTGIVVFARGPLLPWVKALFVLQ